MRIHTLLFLALFSLPALCRATPPELAPSPLNIIDFGDTIIIAWPVQDHADQTGRALLTAIDPDTGTEKWSKRGPLALTSGAPIFPVRHNPPLLIVRGTHGTSVALSAHTGDIAWESAPISVCGPHVGLTETGDAIDLDTGKVAWQLGHPLFGNIAAIDAAANTGLFLAGAGPTPLPVELLDLAHGDRLAQGVVTGLDQISLLAQRGDTSYIADQKTLITLKLRQPAAEIRMPMDDPATLTSRRRNNLRLRWESPPPAITWERPGHQGGVQVDFARSVGTVQIHFDDARPPRITSIAPIASVLPVRNPGFLMTPGPSTHRGLVPYVIALILLAALFLAGIIIFSRKNAAKN